MAHQQAADPVHAAGARLPATEAYFDIYAWAPMNEYTVMQNLGPTAYVWGYLAARK
jgi:endoglucanase